jgi:hypothetical protein
MVVAIIGCSILALANCVAVADAAWLVAAKEKFYSRKGGGG